MTPSQDPPLPHSLSTSHNCPNSHCTSNNKEPEKEKPRSPTEEEPRRKEIEERDERCKDFVMDIVLERLEREGELSEGDVAWGR